MTWEDVVAIGLALPGVELGTAYGTGALRVRGRFLCRERDDRTVLAVRCDPDEKQLLLDAHPDALFVTPHYETAPMVLVALERADPDLVRELVEDAWADRAPVRLVEQHRAGRR